MKIKDFQIIHHGLDHPDYFQGCGVSFTKFNSVVTGIGDNPKEAFNDCLEQIAMIGLDISTLEEKLEAIEEKPSTSEIDNSEESEFYYYLSVRFNKEEI